MQYDIVLKKLNYDLLTQRSSGWVGKIFAIMLLYFVIPFFYMQHDHVLKKLNFDPLTIRSRRGVGVCRQNICYHVAILRDSILFDMQHDHDLKKLNFDLLTSSLGWGGG